MALASAKSSISEEKYQSEGGISIKTASASEK